MRFSKYHGLGNDFVVVDLRDSARADGEPWPEDAAIVRALCDRQFGVGGDGVLPILPPRTEGAHARMRVLNSDASEAEMCGNGLRCVVKHLYETDPALRQSPLVIDTGAGALSCEVTTNGDRVASVTVDMGAPITARGKIPMTGPADERCLGAPVPIDGRELSLYAVSMGNPHAIAFVDETGADLLDLANAIGPSVETHAWFPNKTNAEFVRVHSPTELEMVVWERGCGITLACGTGACAVAVAACLAGHSDVGAEITVQLLGGPLAITVANDYRTVYMRGPAAHIFDADADLRDVAAAARPA